MADAHPKQTPSSQGTPRARRYAPGHRPFRLRLHGWLRWLHTYISMFSLLSILFFALTGITLNHPDWTFTGEPTPRVLKGKFPPNWNTGGKVDLFRVGEYLRAHDGVRGTADPVDPPQPDDDEGTLTYKAPGYNADCVFSTKTGTYELTVTTQGFVGMMNDFHRGNSASSGWRSLIDVSGILLSFVALTGLGLLVYLKKLRASALIAMGVGALIVIVLMKLSF